MTFTLVDQTILDNTGNWWYIDNIADNDRGHSFAKVADNTVAFLHYYYNGPDTFINVSVYTCSPTITLIKTNTFVTMYDEPGVNYIDYFSIFPRANGGFVIVAYAEQPGYIVSAIYREYDSNFDPIGASPVILTITTESNVPEFQLGPGAGTDLFSVVFMYRDYTNGGISTMKAGRVDSSGNYTVSSILTTDGANYIIDAYTPSIVPLGSIYNICWYRVNYSVSTDPINGLWTIAVDSSSLSLGSNVPEKIVEVANTTYSTNFYSMFHVANANMAYYGGADWTNNPDNFFGTQLISSGSPSGITATSPNVYETFDQYDAALTTDNSILTLCWTNTGDNPEVIKYDTSYNILDRYEVSPGLRTGFVTAIDTNKVAILEVTDYGSTYKLIVIESDSGPPPGPTAYGRGFIISSSYR